MPASLCEGGEGVIISYAILVVVFRYIKSFTELFAHDVDLNGVAVCSATGIAVSCDVFTSARIVPPLRYIFISGISLSATRHLYASQSVQVRSQT